MVKRETYEGRTINVLAVGNQGIKRIRAKVDQHIITLKDGTKIHFELEDVINIWCPGIIRGRYKPGVRWRVGSKNALKNGVDGEDYLPAHSQKDATQFVKRQILDALDSGKQVIEGWRFWVLCGCLIALLVLVTLSLFGIQFNVSTPTIIYNQTMPTVTRIPYP